MIYAWWRVLGFCGNTKADRMKVTINALSKCRLKANNAFDRTRKHFEVGHLRHSSTIRERLITTSNTIPKYRKQDTSLYTSTEILIYGDALLGSPVT
eukprot:SAG31_NODE_24652_length_477_cov_0.679894_2_plen_96_part_01